VKGRETRGTAQGPPRRSRVTSTDWCRPAAVRVAFSCERASHGARGAIGRAIDGHEPVNTRVIGRYVAIWSQAYADVTLHGMVRFRKPNSHTVHSLSEPAEREAEAPLHVCP
jgi:uncharacterized phage protein gp47/JayE